MIIEQVPNQSIKIQTKDRSVFVFKFDEIEKLTREGDEIGIKEVEFKKNGLTNITELATGIGVGEVEYVGITGLTTMGRNEEVSFGFRNVTGYQVNEHLNVGLGLGIDKYKSATLLPVTFDARGVILKGRTSPVFNINIGYSFALNDKVISPYNYYYENANGLIVNPSLGIRTYISKGIAFIFNVGYKWQGQERRRIGNTPPETSYFQFITINIGFNF